MTLSVNKDYLASEEARNKTAFRQKLEELINEHNQENTSNSPDFILADYLVAVLAAFDVATIARDKWSGFVSHREDTK